MVDGRCLSHLGLWSWCNFQLILKLGNAKDLGLSRWGACLFSVLHWSIASTPEVLQLILSVAIFFICCSVYWDYYLLCSKSGWSFSPSHSLGAYKSKRVLFILCVTSCAHVLSVVCSPWRCPCSTAEPQWPVGACRTTNQGFIWFNSPLFHSIYRFGHSNVCVQIWMSVSQGSLCSDYGLGS